MTLLKVTNKQPFTLFLEKTFLEKPQGVVNPAFLGLNTLERNIYT